MSGSRRVLAVAHAIAAAGTSMLCSGSPVFNSSRELITLHHSASASMPEIHELRRYARHRC
jgi:hypothetical protein